MKQKYDVCVIGGCGHVGLPLSLAFADSGLKVVAYDINQESVKTVASGTMPFMEEDAQGILESVLASGSLTVTTDPSVISESRVVVSIIGTPVNEHLNPEFGQMIRVLGEFGDRLRDGQLLVLRSTVFPGTSESVQRWLNEKGKNIHVAFCPERIAEGVAIRELHELPQIVSSFSAEGLSMARELFQSLTDKIVETTPLEAELTKLFTNSWRYIRFAAANQFFMIANSYGADFDNIYKAMTEDYPRAHAFPKPGFSAGPCLFKDTMQLSASSSNTFFLGHSAMLINEGLPNYMVGRLRQRFNLRDLTVGVLGMAFKANVDDKRDSLSYKLRDLLYLESKKVLCSDPFVTSNDFVSAEQLIDQSDLVIVATPHSVYRQLDFCGKIVIDIWNTRGEGLLI
ncbi:MAG: nucleotide sugar dehydrogenase [Bacilli bacterium]